MKELKLEGMTVKQKLGMTYTAVMHGANRDPKDDEFVLGLIKEHALGAVWIQQGFPNTLDAIAKVKEVADYPILIMTDGESGVGEYLVGKHSAIGTTGSEKHAYAFGKAVGVTARKMGYNVVCDPVVDMVNGFPRSMGTDMYQVAKLAAAEARGMHDGGVLTVGKHYPGGKNKNHIDSHMGQSISDETKEDLLAYSLYPYLKLNEEGLLDGIMVSHKKFEKIDPDHPATLSKNVIDIIRETGYNGFAITDALCMMSIQSQFGYVDADGLAISAGIDTILPYSGDNIARFQEYCEAYEKGMIEESRLDEAVERILEAQHKTLSLPKDTELTEDDIKTFHNINRDGVYAKTDDGLTPAISRDGKHYFALMVRNEVSIGKDGGVDVDTFSNGWHYPDKIMNRIKEFFPNADVQLIYQFPTQGQMVRVLEDAMGHDEVVFMTFTEPLAYTGKEYLTHRMVNLITAMQLTNRISTVVHQGNPLVLEELPHIPRYILGGLSEASVDACLEVLAGEYPANGVLISTAKLN